MKSRGGRWAILAVMLGLVAGTGCRRGGGPPDRTRAPRIGGTRGLRDEAGRDVVPRAWPARRLISLAPNVTEVLFALGAGAEVVGIDIFSDLPRPQVDTVARVGSDYTPSLEKIAELAPDVVIVAASANRRETVDGLQALGIPTFVTDTRSLADMDRLWRDLGLLTGRVQEAEAAVRRLHVGLDAVRARVTAKDRPAVLVVVWSEPLYVAGQQTFVDDLIGVAGGRNVAREVSGFVRYPLERVLKMQPDVIVIPTHAPGFNGAAAVAYWDRWPTIPAVSSHRVHAVEDSVIIRPGPRLVEAAETLLALIHPPPAPR
jgi:iron complex transport system substrate-binding protein